jgi:tetratricopeptide (TPR) repeat protein
MDHFHRNSIQAARKEFLIALTYNPGHVQALDFLKHKLIDPDYIIYETKGGDTLRKIAQQIYRDPEKEFLIAYFNELLEIKNPLESGMTLRLPILASAWMAKPTYSEEVLRKSDSPPKTRKLGVKLQDQAEVHYAKGIRHFLAEELDKAIEEWEETLRLNPDHPNAKRDLQKARRMLETLRKIE